MNKFNIKTKFSSGGILVELSKEPSVEEKPLLLNLIKKKNGDTFAGDPKVFTLGTPLNEVKLEMLFNTYNLRYVSELLEREAKEDRKRKKTKDVYEQLEVLKDRPEPYIMTFGQYKESPITDVPDSYLDWIIKNHFVKKIRDLAQCEKNEREIVYIATQ